VGKINNYLSIIKSALDGSVKRSELISNNIANIGTPNYKRQDIDFKSILSKKIDSENSKSISIKTTNEKHIPFRKEYTSQTLNSKNNLSFRNDQNNVDIDYEMAEMAKNSIYYNVMTRRAAGHFSNLNQVINQGGK
jgi:flagellar basal-body rod protein FlgB